MKYRINHVTRYRYQALVPIGHTRVCLAPRRCANQEPVRTQLEVVPSPAYLSQRVEDYYGHEVRYFSVQSPHVALEITSHSEVEILPAPLPDMAASLPWEQARDTLRRAETPALLDAYQFTFASGSVELSPELGEYTAGSFTPGRPILSAAVDLMGRIHRDFQYDPQATNVSTPILEVFQNRRGVCQDFAHLQIGCLRTLGLAARYVSGYIAPKRSATGIAFVGSQASHAWLSVYSPGQGWVDLDPTNDVVPSTDHITLAWGRDYDEVAPVRGVILGGGYQDLEVSVSVVAV